MPFVRSTFLFFFFFFFNDPATTEIYTLSLHDALPITANPWARSQSVARRSRPVVSRIAVMDQSSAPVSAGGALACRRFQATRQRAEQNRACSRRGANTTSHCSQFLISAIEAMLRVTTSPQGPPGHRARAVPPADYRKLAAPAK